jgi:hypothetical protein
VGEDKLEAWFFVESTPMKQRFGDKNYSTIELWRMGNEAGSPQVLYQLRPNGAMRCRQSAAYGVFRKKEEVEPWGIAQDGVN